MTRHERGLGRWLPAAAPAARPGHASGEGVVPG